MYILYYQDDCPHCEEIMSLVKKNNFYLKYNVTFRNIDDSAEIFAEFEKNDAGRCEGVPLLFDTKNNRTLCGEVGESDLLSWVKMK